MAHTRKAVITATINEKLGNMRGMIVSSPGGKYDPADFLSHLAEIQALQAEYTWEPEYREPAPRKAPETRPVLAVVTKELGNPNLVMAFRDEDRFDHVLWYYNTQLSQNFGVHVSLGVMEVPVTVPASGTKQYIWSRLENPNHVFNVIREGLSE